jgi:hypothetical protein
MIGVVLGALWWCGVFAPPDNSSAEQKPRFKITTRKANDSVSIDTDKDRTVFVVKSPFGISQADIERLEDQWPAAVVLRLHLKGLEGLKIGNGKVTLHAAVSVQDGKAKVRLWKDGKEEAVLDEKSPWWMPIRVVGGDGKPARELPLKDGFFEISLPQAFFEGNPKTITAQWIDFYRG